MLMLDIFFVVISVYLLCGWFRVEKYLSADKETSNKNSSLITISGQSLR